MTLDEYIYKKNFSISTKDADFKKDLRISSLVNFFIQAAWKHAEELGVGYSHLSKIGVGWIFSRFKIKIDNLPTWPGEISITTWPKGLDRILYIRDAELHSPDNIKLASITSAWLVVDMHTKRLKRSLPEAEFFTNLKMKHAIDEPIPALKFDDEGGHSTHYTVRYNDIDMNMHLTTVRYIDFVFDTYDIEFLNENTPKELTVNFIKEIPFGAELIMHRYEGPDAHRFELENLSNKLICFRAEVKYESSLKNPLN